VPEAGSPRKRVAEDPATAETEQPVAEQTTEESAPPSGGGEEEKEGPAVGECVLQ
jgi:hypothetical protein